MPKQLPKKQKMYETSKMDQVGKEEQDGKINQVKKAEKALPLEDVIEVKQPVQDEKTSQVKTGSHADKLSQLDAAIQARRLQALQGRIERVNRIQQMNLAKNKEQADSSVASSESSTSEDPRNTTAAEAEAVPETQPITEVLQLDLEENPDELPHKDTKDAANE